MIQSFSVLDKPSLKVVFSNQYGQKYFSSTPANNSVTAFFVF